MLALAAPAAIGFTAPFNQAPKPVKPKGFCGGMPGAIAPLGEFDPLGFSAGKDALELNRLREAELTHGRVGMLASLGFLVQEKFHPLFTADGGPAIEQIPKLPVGVLIAITIGITFTESLRISAGFANPVDGEIDTKVSPVTAFPKEDTTFQRLRVGYTPGDLGFDPLGLKPEDPAEFRIMQEKELSHGRLGMIAAAGFMAQEAVSSATWGTWWGDASF